LDRAVPAFVDARHCERSEQSSVRAEDSGWLHRLRLVAMTFKHLED
jgi:hypothetical protein